MNKGELLTHLEESRELFLSCIEDLSDSDLIEPGVIGDWSIKDILVHLSRWESELIKLLWQIATHQHPTSLHFDPKLNVETVNLEWFLEGQSRPLERVLEDFHAVRNQTILRAEKFSENELFDPQQFSWFKGRPLVTYIENDSFGHEEEHIVDIEKWKAQRKEK
jgi:hypothetical protein